MSALMRSPETSHTGRQGKALSAFNQPLTPTALTLQSYASLGNIIRLLTLPLLTETPSYGDNCKLTLSRPPSFTLTSNRHSACLSARSAATVPTFSHGLAVPAHSRRPIQSQSHPHLLGGGLTDDTTTGQQSLVDRAKAVAATYGAPDQGLHPRVCHTSLQ
ncbi:hypothetical protein ISCGN_003481 [Ixodes scapularis]